MTVEWLLWNAEHDLHAFVHQQEDPVEALDPKHERIEKKGFG